MHLKEHKQLEEIWATGKQASNEAPRAISKPSLPQMRHGRFLRVLPGPTQRPVHTHLYVYPKNGKTNYIHYQLQMAMIIKEKSSHKYLSSSYTSPLNPQIKRSSNLNRSGQKNIFLQACETLSPTAVKPTMQYTH